MMQRLIILSLAFAAPAAATSITAVPPHKPEQACGVLAGLLQGLGTTERPQLTDILLGLQITTDDLGSVGWEEWDALIASLRTHNGKADQRPMRVQSLRRIDDGHEKTAAIYVAAIERERWELKRYVGDDGLLMPVYEPDPHFEAHSEFWIIRFSGNRIVSLREADELYPIAFGEDRQDCRGVVPG